jgi:ABC-2 type transport system permease protein
MSSAHRIDWRQARALVRCYIVMSIRTLPIRTMRGERGGSGIGSMLFVIGLYTLLGLALSVTAALTQEVFVYSFTLHMMTLFVVGTSALNEASEVLFSSKENDVLLHRPVQPATLVLSKAITIVSFTALLAVAINLFPTFAILSIKDARPWAPIVHAGSVVLSTVFASAAVVCLYGLVARLLGRERFQRVITAAQIASTVFLAAGFQVLPRLFRQGGGIDLAGFLHDSNAAWFLPPCWFAAIDAWLGSNAIEPRYAKLALVGLAVTLGSTWLGVLRLPSTRNNAASVAEETYKDIAGTETTVVESRGLLDRLFAPWLRDPIERASFRLARAYLWRERTVKVRLAAALAFYLVMPFIAITDAKHAGFMPLMLLWMTALVPVTALEVLRNSSNPAAADLFLYTPIQNGIRIFHGVRKAVIVFVQAPMLIYVAAVSLWIMRENPSRMLLVLPPLLVLPTISLLPALFGEYLPLSRASRTGQRTVQTLLVFVAILPAAALGGAAYFAQQNGLLWILFAIALPLMVAIHLFMLRVVERKAALGRA